MRVIRIARNPYTSLCLNVAYALGNCFLGFQTYSWWFITVGAYFAVLATTRFSVLQIIRKANGDHDTELFARRITGKYLAPKSEHLENRVKEKRAMRRILQADDEHIINFM